MDASVSASCSWDEELVGAGTSSTARGPAEQPSDGTGPAMMARAVSWFAARLFRRIADLLALAGNAGNARACHEPEGDGGEQPGKRSRCEHSADKHSSDQIPDCRACPGAESDRRHVESEPKRSPDNGLNRNHAPRPWRPRQKLPDACAARRIQRSERQFASQRRSGLRDRLK